MIRFSLYKLLKKFPLSIKQIGVRIAPRFVNYVLGRSEFEVKIVNLEKFKVNPLTVTNQVNLIAVVGIFPPIKSGIAWNTYMLMRNLKKDYNVHAFSSETLWDTSTQDIFHIINLSDFNDYFRYKFILVAVGNGSHFDEVIRALNSKQFTNVYIILHDLKITGIKCPPGIKLKRDSLGLELIPDGAKLLVHSKYAQKILRNDNQGKTREIEIIEMGVPVDDLVFQQIGFGRNKKVGSFGYFDYSKKPNEIFDIFQLIAISNPDATFVWVCNLPLEIRSNYLRMWTNQGLDLARLQLISFADETELRQLMSQCRVAIQLRAYTNGESSGIAAEIISCGTPLIQTRIGAHAELPEELVKFVEVWHKPDDIAEIASSILELDDQVFEKLSSECKSWGAKRSCENYASEILSMIENDLC